MSIRLGQTRGHWSDSGSLTMTGWAGVCLDANVSVEMCEVKSRLGLKVFVSGEPRNIGWSVPVRLMVLWLLNGGEGWFLSQSACRQCNGKNRMCAFVHSNCYICIYLWNPTFEKGLSFYIKTTTKQGTRLLLQYCVIIESSTGWQRNHLSQPCSLLKLS